MDDPLHLFDRTLVRARIGRARRFGAVTFLEDRVAGDFADRLSFTLRDFDVAADLGGRTGAALSDLPNVGRVVTLDPVGPADVIGDEDLLPFGSESLDLIVSAFVLSFVNDLPGALIQCRRALKPDGLFLGVLAGAATLRELRDAFFSAETELTGGITPRVAPFVEVRDAGGLLQRAGFALPVADSETVTVRYASALHLMHDLRAMGATNALTERARTPLTRALLMRMADIYAERYSDPDGKVRATFEIVHVSGWGPDESQQKPLKPGSARMRLADALGVSERSAGEAIPVPKKP